MNATNQTTVNGSVFHYLFGHDLPVGMRLLLIVVMTVLAHLTVMGIRRFGEWLINKNRSRSYPLKVVVQQPKVTTVIQLVTHGVTFIIYFLALGLVFEELGVDLRAYLASASIVGLAISFGSQGLVQDVVISLTLIFSNAMDVGDMVEIFGVTDVVGRLEEIGLRFTLIRNQYNQVVFIPNRTIANVSRYPHGGVFAYADVQLPSSADPDKVTPIVQNTAQGLWAQFGAIILQEPVVGSVENVSGDAWRFVRVHFVIWPGQNSLIETTFRQQVVMAMKAYQADYADWQVPVTYRAIAVARKV